MVLTWWLAAPTALTSDRTNFLYLSTLTRSSGLLLGAGAAFVWRPWKARATSSRAGAMLSVAGLAAAMLLVFAFTSAHLTDRSLYRWQLAAVSLLSLVVVAVVVHPAASMARSFFGSPMLVAIGKRSYGIYLWSWPIAVICGAYVGSWNRFIMAMSLTIVVSEFSYLYIETPIRKGALRRWFDRRRDTDWSSRTLVVGAVGVVVLVSLAVFYNGVQRFDRAAGGARRRHRRVQGAVARRRRARPCRCCGDRRRFTVGQHHARCCRGSGGRGAVDGGCSVARATRWSGSSGDRRRLAGPFVGDQPSIRHRERLQDHRWLGRGLQRVRRRNGALGAPQLQPIVRRLRWLGRQVGEGSRQGPRAGRPGRARRMGRVRRRGGRTPDSRSTHRQPIADSSRTSATVLPRCVPPGRRWRCSRCRACGPRMSKEPGCRRFPSVPTTGVSPT